MRAKINIKRWAVSALLSLFLATSLISALGGVAAAVTDPTSGGDDSGNAVTPTSNMSLDRSTIQYNGQIYYDSKIDDSYVYQLQGDTDRCTDTINNLRNNNTTATLNVETPDVVNGGCDDAKSSITLGGGGGSGQTNYSLMPFVFVTANTIMTSDGKTTYSLDTSVGKYLEVGGDKCKDFITVTTPDNGQYAVLSVTASTAGKNTSYDDWSNPSFNTDGTHINGGNGCHNSPPNTFQASTLYLNYSFLSNPQVAKNGGNGFSGGGQGGAASAAADTTPSIDCHVSVFNPLSWILCPLASGLETVAGGLDSAINSKLTFNVSSLDAFSQGFDSIRDVALGLIAIGALVAIVSQAAGLEFLDAYTIRKVMPRVLVCAIGISLAWPLLKFFIGFSNDLGNGVRSLIYLAANGHNSGTGQITLLGGGGQAVENVLAIGGIVALGFVGLLSFAGTAALAAAIAYLVLVLRQMLIIVLVIFAPIAIAAYVLPNTHKGWKLWWESFSKALMMFPIISAFIAVGRVFAATSGDNVLTFVAYFAPYFLLPFAFRLAGGALSTIAGVVNDRGKGGFDRLRNFRSQQPSKRLKAAQQGELYKERSWIPGSGRIAHRANRIAQAPTMGPSGHFGVGARGAARRSTLLQTNSDNYLKEHPDLAKTLLAQDDTAAVMGLSGGTQAGARRSAARLQQHWEQQYIAGGASADEARAQASERSSRALTSALALGVNEQSATAALGVMSQNKSRAIGAGGFDMVRQGIAELAHGNDSLAQDLAYSYQYNSRQAGRQDLGGDWTANNDRVRAINEQERTGVITAQEATQARQRAVLMDGVSRSENRAMVGGHDNTARMAQQVAIDDFQSGDRARMIESARVLSEMYGNISAATGGSRDILEQTLATDLGIDVAGPGGVNQQLANRIEQITGAPVPVGDITNYARVFGAASAPGSPLVPPTAPPPPPPVPSDRRLKENIVHLETTATGIKLYRFNYVGGSKTYVGVMAQDILETHPQAVTLMPNGYYAVSYELLGLHMYQWAEWQAIQTEKITQQ